MLKDFLNIETTAKLIGNQYNDFLKNEDYNVAKMVFKYYSKDDNIEDFQNVDKLKENFKTAMRGIMDLYFQVPNRGEFKKLSKDEINSKREQFIEGHAKLKEAHNPIEIENHMQKEFMEKGFNNKEIIKFSQILALKSELSQIQTDMTGAESKKNMEGFFGEVIKEKIAEEKKEQNFMNRLSNFIHSCIEKANEFFHKIWSSKGSYYIEDFDKQGRLDVSNLGGKCSKLDLLDADKEFLTPKEQWSKKILDNKASQKMDNAAETNRVNTR